MRWLPPLLALVVALAACTSASVGSTSTTIATTLAHSTSTMVTAAAATPPDGITTLPGHDGTRCAAGIGSLPTSNPVDIAPPKPPVWVVGIPAADGPIWTVALESETVVGVHGDGSIAPLGSIPPGAPPAFAPFGGHASLVQPPQQWGSPRSHPILLAPAPMGPWLLP